MQWTQGYDYTQQGAYFITIVTHHRAHMFGEAVDGDMRLNAWGDIVRDEWFKTAQIQPYVQLRDDESVAMPNHIHGIIWIVGNGDDSDESTHYAAPLAHQSGNAIMTNTSSATNAP